MKKNDDIISILEIYKSKKYNLIPILQDVQKNYGYVSEANLGIICDYVGVPVSKGYAVITFYQSLKLVPTGEHEIHICLGTACHLKGAGKILNELKRKLKIEPGETTKDMKITYDTVNCVGACAIAPVVKIDDEYYPKMNSKKMAKEIEKL